MTVKLTPENIERIEAFLNWDAERGSRSAIIEFDVKELAYCSGFKSVLRELGVSVPKHPVRQKGSAWIHPAEKAAFQDWLKEKRIEKDASR